LAVESGLRIRAARPDEAGSIAPLLYEIAPRSYTRFAGSHATEIDRRQWMTMRVALSRLPPWRWPRALRLFLLDRGAIDGTPPRSFYVDSLITVASERRRGVAPAALYEGVGFEVRGSQQPRSGDPEELLYVKLLGATRPAP
jgi:hypothetical protein